MVNNLQILNKKDFNVAEESLLDLNLKVHTYSIYHEELLFELKSDLQRSLNQIERDVQLLSFRVNSCDECRSNKSLCSSSPTTHPQLAKMMTTLTLSATYQTSFSSIYHRVMKS